MASLVVSLRRINKDMTDDEKELANEFVDFPFLKHLEIRFNLDLLDEKRKNSYIKTILKEKEKDKNKLFSQLFLEV